MANGPSVVTVLYKQSKTPLYKLPVWLYIRDIIVSGLSFSCAQEGVEIKKLTWWMHENAHDEAAHSTAGKM